MARLPPGSAVAARPPLAKRSCSSCSASLQRFDVVRRARRCRRRSRGSARPRRRRAARPRGSAAPPRGTRTPSRRGRPCRGRRRPGSAAAAPPSRAAARARPGAARTGSARAGRRGPRSCAHSRSDERKSPRKRASTSSPDSSSAVRNGRGSRLPKKLPVCVIRKRSPGVYSSPAKSSKSQPFEIVTTLPVGEKPRASSAIASETHVIASAERATSRATPPSTFSFARTAMLSERRCGCATSESRRSATHFAPVAFFTAAPTKWIGVRGRGRDDDVDLVPARDPDRGRDRGQVPAHVLVRDEQAPRGKPRQDERALEPLLAVQLLGRPAGPSGPR